MEHSAGDLIAGRYEVLAVVAYAADVAIYTARDNSTGRRVGIRHWPEDGGRGPEASTELEHEAQLTSRLQSVHLLRHIDHFRSETPRGVACYLVHELCDGESLADWASGQAKSEADARAVATQLLRLADYLHRQSPPIFHGAIRADNVLRRSDGRLFVTGFVPPTAQGRASAAENMAADLRAIGETLLFVLSGRPVSGAWAHPAALANVSRELRPWLQRMLAGDSGGFASAAEAMHALRQTPQRNPFILYALLAVALMAATVAGGFVFMRWAGARLRPSRAVASQQQLAKPMANTRFVPKARETAPRLRLARLHSLSGHWAAVFDARFDPSGDRIASASYDGSVRLWSAHHGSPLRTFAHDGKVGAVAFAAGGRLCSGGAENVRVWDIETGQLLHTLAADPGQVTSIAPARAGTHVVAGGFEGTVRVFELDSGRLVRTMTQPGRVLAVAADGSGQRVASAGDDGIVRVFRFEDGSLEHALAGHSGAVNEVVFSADGQTLVSASDDRTVRVWYLPAAKPMRTLSGHRDEVWAIALDPTGKQLASASKDGELRLWDLYTGELQLAQQVDPRGVIALAYSPDGGRLAVGGGSQRVDVYELQVVRDSWRPPPITAPVKNVPFKVPAGVSAEMALVLEARELLNDGEGGHEHARVQTLLTRALAHNPKSAPAYVELARLEQSKGYIRGREYDRDALKRSDDMLKRALEIDPNLYEAQLRLGYSFLDRKDFARSMEAAQRAERLRPGDPRTQILLMNLADYQDEDEQLMLHARALIESSDDRGHLRIAYAKLRDIYQHRGEIDAADDMYRSVINLDPESAWSKGNYANFLIRHERYDEAIEWAQAAIAQMDYGAARHTLAEAYARKAHDALDRRDEAAYQHLIGQAFHAAPSSAEAHYVRGMYHRGKGDEAAARREFEAALRTDSEHRAAARALKAAR